MISSLSPLLDSHFFNFVPGSVRAQFGDELRVPLISTQLFAERKQHLIGPILEVTWPGTSALCGVLRAVQRHDAVLAIRAPRSLGESVSTTSTREMSAQWVSAVLSIAESVHYTNPLAIIGTVYRDHSVRGSDWARHFSEALYAEIEAGYTALTFEPRHFGLERAREIASLTEPLQELGIGIEVEFEEGDPAAIYLAQLEDAGLPIAAVRGASLFDDCAGIHVVDPVEEDMANDVAMRVNVDVFVLKALERILNTRERLALHADIVAFGASEALTERLSFFSELSDEERSRVEAFTDMTLDAAIVGLRADGVASALLDPIEVAGPDEVGE